MLLAMNQFGGNWTEAKMQIVVAYAKAYLTIMNSQKWAKTLYFDGFAGSGTIETKEDTEALKGTALRILEINEPKPFDTYYFVEKEMAFKKSLEKAIQANYPNKKYYVVQGDCNEKLVSMAGFLEQNTTYRALCFIDPYGMSVNWNSIEALQGLGIDLWILVPTGLGVNRLLKNNGEISEAWFDKLESFLGLTKEDIVKSFYKTQTTNTLFGDVTKTEKEKASVQKISDLYSWQLKTIFKYVSEPFVMRNRNNSIMYHFMMATNNKAALNIANDVIKPKYRL